MFVSDLQEALSKFMAHVRQQPRTTYVPMVCAEKILEQVHLACLCCAKPVAYMADTEVSATRHEPCRSMAPQEHAWCRPCIHSVSSDLKGETKAAGEA